MKKVLKRILLFGFIIISVMVSGCGTHSETVIRDQVIDVKVPDIQSGFDGTISGTDAGVELLDSVFAVIPDDVIIEGTGIIVDSSGRVTSVKSRLLPHKKGVKGPVFEVEVVQPPVKGRVVDTTTGFSKEVRPYVSTTEEETWKGFFMNKINIMVWIVIAVLICGLVGRYVYRKNINAFIGDMK